jgi:hypothetical protein
MPSTSKKQHNLMAMVANDPAAAKRVGIKQSVGKEFLQADKDKKFAKGGETMAKMKHDDIVEDKKIVKKAIGMHDKQLHGGKKTELASLKKGGCAPKKMATGGLAAGHKSADGCATKGKTKARQVTMCGGGMAKKGK